LNAFAGFAKHLALLASQGEHLAGSVLAVVTILGIGGSILGQRFGSRLPAAALRRSFGGALIVLAIFMLWHNSY
jgi:uncharacterized membrane protein YfcA